MSRRRGTESGCDSSDLGRSRGVANLTLCSIVRDKTDCGGAAPSGALYLTVRTIRNRLANKQNAPTVAWAMVWRQTPRSRPCGSRGSTALFNGSWFSREAKTGRASARMSSPVRTRHDHCPNTRDALDAPVATSASAITDFIEKNWRPRPELNCIDLISKNRLIFTSHLLAYQTNAVRRWFVVSLVGAVLHDP